LTVFGGEIAEMARESPEDFQNTCAARLSKALNYAGFKIPKGTAHTFLGGDGNYYFLQAKAMVDYISKRLWRAPTLLKKNHHLNNAAYFQEGFGRGVTGHLDIMFRQKAAHEFYRYPGLTTTYW